MQLNSDDQEAVGLGEIGVAEVVEGFDGFD